MMKVIHNIEDMTLWSNGAAKSLGLVPTMGALHEGHLSLVRQARSENATVVVSIFVNPTQFGDGEDIDTYPRDLGADLDVLETEGVDVVFVPNTAEIYPDGYDTWIDVGNVADKLEGRLRKGHFRGVATVVTKLFCVVRPDVGYFGQKDGQQAVIIRQIVRDLNLGVIVRVCPTMREHNGLALSSRNVYLNEKEKFDAPIIYTALRKAEDMWRQGEIESQRLKSVVENTLRSCQSITTIDYVSVADTKTLNEVDMVVGEVMISVAARIGSIRLIDNLILDGSEATE
jgi:pantoate--beta-alanine ligase